MTRVLVAALCAVFALAFAGAAMAGNPIGNIIVKGGKNPGGLSGKVVIAMGGEAWSFDPATDTIVSVDSEQGARDAGDPVPRIAVTAARNPGGAATALPAGESGTATMPKLDDGTYDLAITIPAESMPSRQTMPGAVRITFGVASKGGVMTRQPRITPKIAKESHGSFRPVRR